MRLKTSSDRYDTLSKTFHWATAVMFLVAVPLGWWAASLGPGNPDPDLAEVRDEILFWHKSFGVTALFLAIPRLIWTILSRRKLLSYLPTRERVLAKLVHASLYGIMLLLPLTGIAMSQAAGFGVSFFGLFDLPIFFQADRSIPMMQRPVVAIGYYVHTVILTFFLYAAFSLHIIGLVKHHFMDKDKCVWQRMSPSSATDAARSD